MSTPTAAPTPPTRTPPRVPAAPPGLLSTLLTQHLDPGYAAAHRRRHGRRPREANRGWLVGGLVVVGVLLGVAGTSAARSAPDTAAVQSGLVANVLDTRRTNDDLRTERGQLGLQADAARRAALTGDDRGRAALAALGTLQQQAGAVAVSGPGLQVTLTDSAGGGSGGGSGGGTVLDRDLQQTVNALWAAGAEAVAVGGVRLDPSSTIRSAGGAMLVDEAPVFSPYVVSAVGGPRTVQTGFLASTTNQRLSAVSQVYGIGFAVVPVAALDLPAATPPELRLATPEPTS